LGLLYNDQGRLNAAEELHRKALAMRVHVFGEDHPDVARSFGALGLVLAQQPERLAEAKGMHRRALAVRMGAFGPWHPEVARSHDFIGVVLRQQGKYGLAEREHRRALLIRAIVYRDKPHREVARSHSNLAEMWRQQGAIDKAARAEHRSNKLLETLKQPGKDMRPFVHSQRGILQTASQDDVAASAKASGGARQGLALQLLRSCGACLEGLGLALSSCALPAAARPPPNGCVGAKVKEAVYLC